MDEHIIEYTPEKLKYGEPTTKDFLETLLDRREFEKLQNYIETLLQSENITRKDITMLQNILTGTLLMNKLTRIPNPDTADILTAVNTTYIMALLNILFDLDELENKLNIIFDINKLENKENKENKQNISNLKTEITEIRSAKKMVLRSILTLIGVVMNWNGMFVGIGGEFLRQAFTQTRVSIQEIAQKNEEERKRGWLSRLFG
jgi:hypothetical protein